MITLKRFCRIEQAVRAAGYGEIIEWSEAIEGPVDSDDFAAKAIYVICNSGLSNFVAEPIYDRCMAAMNAGRSSSTEFRHKLKTAAMDAIWADRHSLFDAYVSAEEPMLVLAELPYIGPVTVYHLAKNLGSDVAKPDVHMDRLATRENTSTELMCRRLSRQTGYRIATVDSVLWRACELGILNSHAYELHGWRRAFRGKPRRVRIEAASQPLDALAADAPTDVAQAI